MVAAKAKVKSKKFATEPLNGSFLFANGDRYVGQYRNSDKSAILRHGQGLQTSASNVVYQGDWENDVMCGQGRMDFPSGDSYVGEFKENQFHDQGTYYWANGSFFTGSFQKNRLLGNGTFTTTNGQSWVGEFNCNEVLGLKLLL
ncbi:MORN repeat-containing protein 2 [Intoshia linei]|uniref:MORN repeat-containing protein 2 n=1 Tax=Intoshia linei TaxID=1819745 RepID=A0A177AYK1_9BILA|nr:MORN repeat-containing protein 2 [Intoshia linei]